jgi:hypothetical protein
MNPSKPFTFVEFPSIEFAINCRNELLDTVFKRRILCIKYVSFIPDCFIHTVLTKSADIQAAVPGLIHVDEFISPEEEEMFLKECYHGPYPWIELGYRKVVCIQLV